MHTSVKKVIHFTDGAASQYKNCKNFTNLLFHKEDFGVEGEWHFFATSHDKGPCDGIGGTIKRLSRRASLQNEITIQTPLALILWCNSNIENIKCFFVSSDDISQTEIALGSRFQSSKTLPGTQKIHCFVPVDLFSVTTKFFSSSEQYTNYVIRRQELNEYFLDVNFSELKVDNIIACVYLGKWYLGKILSRDEGQVEINVHFFKPPGEELTIRGFQLSAKDDVALVPLSNVIQIVKSLKKKKLVVLEILMLMKKN